MKKILTIIAMIVSVFFVGCNPDLTTEQITNTSKSIGAAAATVANLTKVDKDVGNAIVKIIGTAKTVVPGAGQSFADAWSPVAKEHIEKLLAEGKIDEAKAKLIESVFGIAVKGLDYAVTKRFPKIANDTEKIRAVIDGFSEGFLNVYVVQDSTTKAATTSIVPDEDAVKYLSK